MLLALVLAYSIIGIPDLNRSQDAMLDTDAVDPLHRFAWIGLFALSLPIAAVRWRQALRLLGASWPLLLLYAYFALSVTWALDPGVSFRRWLLTVIQLLLGAVLLSGLRRASTLHLLIAAVCAAGAVADLLTYVAAPGYAMAEDGFVGLQLQKNLTGLLMMYGCLATGTAFAFARTVPMRAALAGAIVLMGFLLLLSRSTTSQSVVLMTPVVAVAMLLFKRMSPSAAWGLVASLLACAAAVVFGYLAWCGIAGADWHAPFAEWTFTSRTDIWWFVVDEIKKRPMLGAGYGSFWAINPAVQPSLKSDDWFGTYAIINEAHNGFLDLLASGGVVGLVGALLVVARTCRVAARAVSGADGVAAAARSGRMAAPTAMFHMALLVGLLVHNLTESNLFSNNSTLVVAFLFAALDLAKWQLATAQPAQARFPNPARQRRTASAAAGDAAASP